MEWKTGYKVVSVWRHKGQAELWSATQTVRRSIAKRYYLNQWVRSKYTPLFVFDNLVSAQSFTYIYSSSPGYSGSSMREASSKEGMAVYECQYAQEVAIERKPLYVESIATGELCGITALRRYWSADPESEAGFIFDMWKKHGTLTSFWPKGTVGCRRVRLIRCVR